MSAPEPPFPQDASREVPGPPEPATERTGPGTVPESTRETPETPEPTSGTAPGTRAPERAPATKKKDADPLRHSRTSGVWAAVVVFVIVLVLLAIFVLQNTQRVQVSFLGWEGRTPLAAALMIATAAGLLLAAAAGTLRILQLRRRVKRERRA